MPATSEPAAIFLGPGDARVARLGLLVLPGLGLLQELGVVVAGAEALPVVALARGVGVEPGAHFLAEGGFFGSVVEVHVVLQSPHPEERPLTRIHMRARRVSKDGPQS